MFLFHKSVEQYRRPKTFDQNCIYIHCGLWCGFSVIQVKASKFTGNDVSREQKVKRRFKQHKWIKLIQHITLIFFCIV